MLPGVPLKFNGTSGGVRVALIGMTTAFVVFKKINDYVYDSCNNCC